ncbi:MAG: hypothetical protein OES32_05970 [Acidobacteriota bacterium]|nr:hypothetical protein [Acidobacteriota bacterium]MDH3523115.1 hypothetical protein [Acidobacteriota bacterium]
MGPDPSQNAPGLIGDADPPSTLAAEGGSAESEARALRLQHRQRVETLGRMAGGIAHHFNNILLTIVGYTELAKSGLEGDSSAAEHLDQVLEAARRAAVLVSGLSSFGRDRAPESAPFDLRQAVAEAGAFLRASLPASTRLELDLGESAVAVRGDANQLYQLVVGLGLDAAHAVPRGGSVRIELRGSGAHDGVPAGHARLAVAHDGGDAAEEIREGGYDRYDPPAEPDLQALARAFAEGVAGAHGGTIERRADAAAGARCTLFLPEYPGPAVSHGEPPRA